jgi:hypothetical protein
MSVHMAVTDKPTRAMVNDVVHSFCYLVRNPQKIALSGDCWPFILHNGKPTRLHGGDKIAVMFENYRYFVTYLLHCSPEGMTIRQGHYMLTSLLAFTATWGVAEFDLAALLMEKYYKMGAGI